MSKSFQSVMKTTSHDLTGVYKKTHSVAVIPSSGTFAMGNIPANGTVLKARTSSANPQALFGLICRQQALIC